MKVTLDTAHVTSVARRFGNAVGSLFGNPNSPKKQAQRLIDEHYLKVVEKLTKQTK